MKFRLMSLALSEFIKRKAYKAWCRFTFGYRSNNDNNNGNRNLVGANDRGGGGCSCFVDSGEGFLIILLIILIIIAIIIIGWLLAILTPLLLASFFFIVQQFGSALSYLLDTHIAINLYGLFKLIIISFALWGVVRHLTLPLFVSISHDISSLIGIKFCYGLIMGISTTMAVITAIFILALALYLVERFIINNVVKLIPTETKKSDSTNPTPPAYQYGQLIVHLTALLASGGLSYALYVVFTTSASGVFSLAWFPNPLIASIMLGLIIFFIFNKGLSFIYEKIQRDNYNIEPLSIYDGISSLNISDESEKILNRMSQHSGKINHKIVVEGNIENNIHPNSIKNNNYETNRYE